MVEQHIASRRGRDGRRAPRADRAGRPVRRDRDRRRTGATSPRSARSRSDPVGLPDAPDQVFASMGNYVFSTEALIEHRLTADAADEDVQARPRRQHHPALVAAGRRAGLRLRRQRGPGRDRPRPRLLARRRDARRLLRRAHGPDLGPPDLQPVQPRVADPHVAGDHSSPRSSSSTRTGRRGHAVDSMVCAGVVISGGTVRRSILSPRAHLHSYALVEDSILMHGVEVGRSAVVRRAILDKNVCIARGRADRRRPAKPTASASTSPRAGSS